MDLSIIIVNYKTKDLLDKCLRSLLKGVQPVEFEIIVIDNNSQDGSVQMLKKEYPQVKLIESQENLGFAKACNQGIRMSQGKHLFFLNPDSEITNGTYERVMNFMDLHHGVGVGGCSLYYPDGRIQASFYKFTSLWNLLGRALLLYSFIPKNRFTAPLFVDYLVSRESIERVCGGAMVVRREALAEVGLFDESFFLYCEDEDLCYRMRQKEWGIASIPNTRIIHHHNQSSKRNIRKAIFSSYQSQFLLYRKFHPLHKVIIFRLIQFIGVSIRSSFWFFKLMVGEKQGVAKKKLMGYLSFLLSGFNCRKSLIN